MNKIFSKKYTFFIIFILIVLTGLFLRFYKLGTNPPSLDWDEASLGYNAYSILRTGNDEYGNKLPLSIRSFDDYKPALYTYLTVPSVFIFGLNEFAVRFPAALIGFLTVVIVYFLAKEIFWNWEKKRRIAISLAATLFFAVSPWHLQFSRAAFEGQVGLFFLIAGLLTFLKAFKSSRYFYFSSISFLLCVYSYHSFRLVIPLLLAFLIFAFWKKISKIKKHALISLIIFFILSLPVWNSFLIRGEGAGSRLSMVTVFSDPALLNASISRINYDLGNDDYIGTVFHNRRIIYMLSAAKGYLDHFNPDFLFLHGDSGVQHHAVDMGMLYLSDIPFILAGIYFLLKKMNRSVFILFLIFLISPLPASITTGTPHPVRAIGMMLGFHFFAAAGLIFFWEKIAVLKNSLLKIAIALVIIFSFVFNLAYYLHQYYVHTPIEYGYFWQYGYKEVFEFAKNNENQFDSIIVTYHYDQPYIYYLFYNKIDPAWYQKSWDHNGNGEIDRFKRIIGKYTFRNINYEDDSKLRNTLLIGTPEEIPEDAKVLKTIEFPDGRIAFKIIKK